MEGTGKPEYDKCVAISTNASLKKMMLPGAIALGSPLIIGFIFGPEVLGGFLAGATVSGVLMGMFQNNAGGAWDNAKKSFEKGAVINGETYYKGSEPHKASVTGDTVGDPFKDTSGPSMNILIKLMSIVSLVIAPSLAGIHQDKIVNNRQQRMENLMLLNGNQKELRNVTVPTNRVEGRNDKVNTMKNSDIKAMIGGLKNDGLIQYEDYTVEVIGGRLFIDGEVQPDQVNNKYRKYFEGKDDIVIRERKVK